MGISKAVSKMNDLTEVFISDLAATKTNDIKELVDFVKVDIGIITDIGYQHMESFKTIENVLQTKLEILASTNLKQLIINNDNQYLKEHIYPENIEIIRVGINNDSDYMAKNIILTNNGLSFDVYNKEIFLFKVDTILLGRHNIYNLLFGIVVGRLLNISVEEIKRNIRSIKPVDNRLSIKNIGKIQIINDAFNSNIKGFINAIEILKYSKNKKILITPGLVDLGELLEEINNEISECIIDGIDYIYLVENNSSKYIQENFIKKGFKNYEMVTSFRKAYNKAINKYEESTILIENDLPDNYLRR
jgi:UDP-N-acetylmuramoyl-tripeptide--D-alanyl-D-alanine ligase